MMSVAHFRWSAFAPFVCNNLPLSLKQMTAVPTFKRQLKCRFKKKNLVHLFVCLPDHCTEILVTYIWLINRAAYVIWCWCSTFVFEEDHDFWTLRGTMGVVMADEADPCTEISVAVGIGNAGSWACLPPGTQSFLFRSLLSSWHISSLNVSHKRW